MARRTRKNPNNYPKVIAFDENLDRVGADIEAANFSLPEIWWAVKGTTDHQLAVALDEQVVFFTSDHHWLTRQPPYKHGGIILLEMGNSGTEDKTKRIVEFLAFFHLKNKLLYTLRNRRFRLTKKGFYEIYADGKKKRLA